MCKIVTLGFAATLAVASMAVPEAEARSRNGAGAAVAAGIVGLAAGAIVAGSASRSYAAPAYGYSYGYPAYGQPYYEDYAPPLGYGYYGADSAYPVAPVVRHHSYAPAYPRTRVLQTYDDYSRGGSGRAGYYGSPYYGGW